jgi:dihydrofolate synthase / folylpolyglutamate synthase
MPDLNAWLSKLERRHLKVGINLPLNRLEPIALKLGLSQLPSHVIKIAGTNGKGSAAVSLAKIYHELGYKAAVYTSPHLFRFNERLKINHKEVADIVWCQAFAAIASFKYSDELTYFEFITIAALFIISQQQLDVVILEIGIGGRLDAVNIVNADIAFIASIGMDHNEWLGNTLEAIAAEKSGITLNSKQLVCTSRVCPETIASIADANGCDGYMIEKDFTYQNIDNRYVFRYKNDKFEFKIPNIHPDIVAGVLMCLILGKARLHYDAKNVMQIFPNIINIGRCNVFDVGAKVLVDVAHNIDSAKYLVNRINSISKNKKIRIIFSCLCGKDIKNITELFDCFEAEWHIYKIADKRAMPIDVIRQYLCAKSYDNAFSAFNKVLSEASESDLIVAFGSFHVAKDILLILENHSSMIEGF